VKYVCCLCGGIYDDNPVCTELNVFCSDCFVKFHEYECPVVKGGRLNVR
jgi:hypothetical protein